MFQGKKRPKTLCSKRKRSTISSSLQIRLRGVQTAESLFIFSPQKHHPQDNSFTNVWKDIGKQFHLKQYGRLDIQKFPLAIVQTETGLTLTSIMPRWDHYKLWLKARPGPRGAIEERRQETASWIQQNFEMSLCTQTRWGDKPEKSTKPELLKELLFTFNRSLTGL